MAGSAGSGPCKRRFCGTRHGDVSSLCRFNAVSPVQNNTSKTKKEELLCLKRKTGKK